MSVAPVRPTGSILGGARRQPVGGNVVRVATVLVLAFAVLAGGAGYWQVFDAAQLSSRPDNPAVIAADRLAMRGRILDRDGRVLAQSRKGSNGEPYRVYTDPAMSPVIGYASRLFGTAGLERAYDALLVGLRRSDPVADMLSKFDANPYDPAELTLSISLSLQQRAVAGLGSDRGAVVMLDPTTGEILALASTPTFDASAIANPATSRKAFAAVQADPALPLLDRAVLGRYVPGSVFKIVTAIAGLGSGAIAPQTTFPEQAKTEKTGLVVSGFRIRDDHNTFTDGRALALADATEVSDNIYYALVGLRTGGAALQDFAAKLGFGAPIPFDLPTAPSQLTNGGGSFGGGFKDSVELANAAYGQAETVVTPLQMALVAATVANGGLLMKPHLVTQITSRGGGLQRIGPERWSDVIAPDQAAAIAAAMEQAVEGPYGRLFTTGAAVPGVRTAGKSGTAQLGGTGEPNSWFIGFAPVDHPRVAIAVVVEHGGRGGARAAPLAGDLLTYYLRSIGIGGGG